MDAGIAVVRTPERAKWIAAGDDRLVQAVAAWQDIATPAEAFSLVYQRAVPIWWDAINEVAEAVMPSGAHKPFEVGEVGVRWLGLCKEFRQNTGVTVPNVLSEQLVFVSTLTTWRSYGDFEWVRSTAEKLSLFSAALGFDVAGSLMSVQHCPLTGRELEALYWFGKGLTVKEAGENMGVAATTVKTYRDTAVAKLGVASVRDAYTRASLAGWLLFVNPQKERIGVA